MWICPYCKRSFINTNQEHSCEMTDPESHFFNKDQNIKAAYQFLAETILGFGDIKVNSVKHAILFTASSNFLVVKPKKRWLDIEFVLKEEREEFPIHKTVQTSKTKWAHFVRIESIEEIDKELIELFRKAYEAGK